MEKNELIKLCELLPKVISSPLNEYISETNPGMKLWFACYTIELLLRFLVILGLNDLKEKNKLNEKILKQFWAKISTNTWSWIAWQNTFRSKDKSRLLVPERVC